MKQTLFNPICVLALKEKNEKIKKHLLVRAARKVVHCFKWAVPHGWLGLQLATGPKRSYVSQVSPVQVLGLAPTHTQLTRGTRFLSTRVEEAVWARKRGGRERLKMSYESADF